MDHLRCMLYSETNGLAYVEVLTLQFTAERTTGARLTPIGTPSGVTQGR